MSSAKATLKSPNVLIYTEGQHRDVFQELSSSLMKCLSGEKHCIYELKKTQILDSPWTENTVLLVIFSEEIEEPIAAAFGNYFKSGGKLLVFSSPLNLPDCLKYDNNKDESSVTVSYKDLECVANWGKFLYNLSIGTIIAQDKDTPLIVRAVGNDGILVASTVHLALKQSIQSSTAQTVQQPDEKCLTMLKQLLKDELGMDVTSTKTPSPTPGYIITKEDMSVDDLKTQLNINMTEIIISKPASTSIDHGTEASVVKVPILHENEAAVPLPFDKSSYYKKLGTKSLGSVVVYFPVVTSTMTPAESFSDRQDVVVVASQQISGLGRGGNVWISPVGCAMFTLNLTLSYGTPLGQHSSLLQHMASLAFVHSVQKVSGYDKLDLRVKWPNDIYVGNDKKIGGVLVTSKFIGNVIQVAVGIGINVSNQHPTVCLNSIIEGYNSVSGSKLPLLKIEEVIASTITELENLIDSYMNSGPDNFLSIYYSYWLHKDQRVTISALNKEATIQGIDKYGYLLAKPDNEDVIVLHPDGNRFDMLKNLIVVK